MIEKNENNTNDMLEAISSATEESVSEETDTASLAEEIFKITDGASEKKAPRKRGMVKKQKIMIISFASAALVLALSYFIFVLPYVKRVTVEEEKEPPELLTGEYYEEKSDTLLMFPKIEKASIQKIEVHNSYGSFTCVNNDGTFYILEYPSAPFSSTTVSSLAVDVGYTVVSRRITTECEDFGAYGLGEDDSPAYYIITDTGGASHTVYLGDYTPNGGGVYCRYEGRNALYVLQASIASTLLGNVQGLISPLLMSFSSDNSTAYAQTDDVIITKNGQPFVEIQYDNYCPKCGGKFVQQNNTYTCDRCGKTSSDDYRVSAYKMIYPSNHTVNDTNYSTQLLLSLCSLSGQSVLEVGSGGKDGGSFLCDDEELMAKYGFHDLANAPYRLSYSYGDDYGAVAFAPSGVDGYYFAYAYEFDTIVLVAESTVPYLEWDILDYINSAIFSENISNVSKLEIKTADGSSGVYFNGKYYTVNESFSIKYVQGESDNSLDCVADRTGKTYSGTSQDLNYIQALYGSVLSMYIEGYAENTIPNEDDRCAEMTVTLNDGTKKEYVFYKTGERCFYTVDGSGEFYIPYYQVRRMLVNAARAATGYPVDNGLQMPDIPDGYDETYTVAK